MNELFMVNETEIRHYSSTVVRSGCEANIAKGGLDGGTRPRAATPTHPHFSLGDGQVKAFILKYKIKDFIFLFYTTKKKKKT